MDNSERLLLREGIIDEIPSSLCDNSASGKNVMLVVGDGMVSSLAFFENLNLICHSYDEHLIQSHRDGK